MAYKVKMPSIAFVVARSYPQRIIGCDNKLPWRLKTDLKFFRSVTEGHAVIMGRKTFDSIGHPLPNRLNIVLSRRDGNNTTNLIWVKNRESALFFADFFSVINERTQVVVIGGAEVYGIFLDLVNKIFLTEVFGKFECGDAYFHEQFDLRKWKSIEEKDYPRTDDDDFPFRISVMERRLKTVRQRELSEFLTKDNITDKWLQAVDITCKMKRFQSLPEEQYLLPMVAG